MEEAYALRQIFQIYEECYGQRLNLQKSDIYFSPNVDPMVAEQFEQIMGIPSVSAYSKYLGLPAMVGRSKTSCFEYLRDNIWDRLMGYKENLLSIGGREVLLKSVVQPLPTYSMSIFKIPKEICDDIKVIMNRLW